MHFHIFAYLRYVLTYSFAFTNICLFHLLIFAHFCLYPLSVYQENVSNRSVSCKLAYKATDLLDYLSCMRP